MMDEMKRYAVYYAPRPGAFADHAAGWLGWDAATGAAMAQPDLAGLPRPLADLTRDPARYGFHGTIRAPFRPCPGVSGAGVAEAVAALAETLAPVRCDGLRLENLHGFLALTPEGCEAALFHLAAAVVEGTDPLRATLTPEEVARRRPESLTSRQRALLERWGYPFVMEEFRFHLTLTDRLPAAEVDQVAGVVSAHFTPVLPVPFMIEDLCLFGEDASGRFHLLHRYALTG
jgi:putative phosphonate metabolism protein